MSDFISKSNCGQILLSLVARGNAVIAELLRLSQFIPAPFRSNELAGKYSELVCDFSYFKTAEYFESRIESRGDLQDLDAEFRETHLEILRRFYFAFESVHKYVSDLNRYLEDLDDGVFVQQSLESVMLNDDGRQLLIEALYLYGVMLLIIDARIEGTIREKLLVSYHRYAAQDASKGASNIDEVCKLMRSTGYVAGGKRPAGYPESFLTRIAIPSTFVRMAIGRLRSDDVYHQIAAYPLPEHRSVALAQQAAMLYVVLYFASDLLDRDAAKMREIVDKHFPDNFVVSVYMGIAVNLIEAWSPYRAASSALNNTLEATNVRALAQRNGAKVRKLRGELDQFLKEGFLTEEFVSDNIGKLMNVLREANATLRWLILHTSPTVPFGDEKSNRRSKQLRDQMATESGFEVHAVLALLVNTSQLELKLRELLRSMLTQKRNIWERYRKEGEERLVELSEVYSGAKPLTRVERNEHLQAWFAEMGRQIANLTLDETTTSGRKIVQLMQALEEVQEFHQLESNLQVKQFLADTRACLHNMLRTINIKEDMLVTLQIVGDLSYAWELVDQFTSTMQESIKSEPALVTRLRAAFLKLASTLDMPLLRINQAQSDDLLSVSQYYSNELVAYVRRVLQVIPETMFQLLAQIIELETKHIRELPTRLDKDKMKDFAQLDERYQVARLTHSVSTLTEGILTMKTTLVGIIKVDPRQLLEDGIRKELVKQITRSLHGVLQFNPKARVSELVPRLDTLFELITGLSRSFEYIQDYINVHGLKIWNEELTRILNFYVEQECNAFLRTKVLEWQSVYQSSTIPIPVFANVPDKNDSSVNFVGRLAREMLRLTDPKVTVFLEQRASWYDVRTKVEVLNPKVFQRLERALSNAGLSGLTRFYSFMAAKELQDVLSFAKRQLLQVAAAANAADKQKASNTSWLDDFFATQIGDSTNVIQQPQRVYGSLLQKFAKQLGPLTDSLCRIGQLQLLRRALFAQLAVTAQFDSKYIYCALDAFNRALMIDIEEHYRAPTSTPYPDDDNPLLYELATYLEAIGVGQDDDSLHKVFITAENVPARLDLVLAALLFAQLNRLQVAKNQDGTLVRRTGESVDVVPFVCGLATLLKQLHSDFTVRFVALCAQFVRSHIETLMASNAKSLDLQPDVIVCVTLLDLVASRAHIQRSVMDTYLTPTVRESVSRLAMSTASTAS